MKFVYPEIDYVFDTDIDEVNTLIIENQALFLSLLTDLKNQIDGLNGKSVLSSENNILSISKSLEVLDRFVPFDMNTKSLISKITADIETKSLSDEYSSRTSELVGQVDSYLTTLSFDYACDIQFTKVNIGSIIKSAGIAICDDYDSLGEKLIDYMQLITEFIGKKLFITVNLRTFISDKDTELFINTVLSHQFNVIMIENHEHPKTNKEKRLIIDSDLCLIG